MDTSADPEIWGTLEELLLSFAISRHGSQSWDSVAMEVRSRSPTATVTADSCRRRYLDLRQRFTDSDDLSAVGDDDDDDLQPGTSIPWLEDLRRLRVAELRRELHRSDVSILSLQSKVKRLKEERERSILEHDGGEDGPDPKDEDEAKGSGSPRCKPAGVPRDRISGSSYESNSTDPGGDTKPVNEAGGQAGECGGRPDPDLACGKPREEASYNGSSDTMARAIAESNPARLGESVAESKGRKEDEEEEEEVSKETSDVQSSASLSRRRRRRWRLTKAASGSSSSSGGPDEPEADADAEPQSLIEFLDSIRSDQYGAVFERRLDSQESSEYKSLIRRHVDLEMVRSNLEGTRGRADGGYTTAEFFRDLLLLCANAIVFYPKDSQEYIAAVHLRELVRKEMDKSITNRPRQRTHSPPEPAAEVEHLPPPPPPVAVPTKLKSEPARASSPLEKPLALGPLITCKKRSSISAKAAAAAAAAAALAEAAKDEKAKEEKPNPIQKEEQSPTRKRKERPTLSGPRGLRSNKARAKNPIPPPPPTQKPATQPESSSEKKTEPPAKKQRIAAPSPSPPSRVKRNWPSSKAPLLESLKKETASGGRSAEGKKGGRAAESKKDSGGRQQGSAASKKATEQTPPARRSVGRPPKKTAPPPSKKAKEEAPPPAKRKRGKK